MESYLEKKIAVSEETVERWKLDHQMAMTVRDCEELLDDVCRYYDQVDRQVKSYVDDVIEGNIPYNFEENQRTKTLCRRCLNLARFSLERSNMLISDGYTVDGKQNLDRCIADAEESERNGFELYAMQRVREITIPRDFVANSGLLGFSMFSYSSAQKLKIGILRHLTVEQAELLDMCVNAERLLISAALSRGHEIEFIYPLQVLGTHDVRSYDVIISRVEIDTFAHDLTDAYLRVSSYFEASGIPVINCAAATINAQDKFRTLMYAKNAGINVPLTFIAYSLEDVSELIDSQQIVFPFFIKQPYGGCGKGVFLVNDYDELSTTLMDNFNSGQPMLVEERIDLETDEYGNAKDMRIWVVRDHVTRKACFVGGAYRIAASGHYVTNICTGGSVLPMEQPYDPELITLSELALESIGADVAGIDVARDKNGDLFLLEINISFGTNKSFAQAIGINIWESVIDLAEALCCTHVTVHGVG
jgi:RimK family alpha-L-glutamate ligase